MGSLKNILSSLTLMDSVQYPFGKIHYLFRKADHAKWQRQESKRHILRSQLGFTDVASTRPKSCTGCANYHGIAYGCSREARTMLVCGFHPYGWQRESACPDWCGAH